MSEWEGEGEGAQSTRPARSPFFIRRFARSTPNSSSSEPKRTRSSSSPPLCSPSSASPPPPRARCMRPRFCTKSPSTSPLPLFSLLFSLLPPLSFFFPADLSPSLRSFTDLLRLPTKKETADLRRNVCKIVQNAVAKSLRGVIRLSSKVRGARSAAISDAVTEEGVK